MREVNPILIVVAMVIFIMLMISPSLAQESRGPIYIVGNAGFTPENGLNGGGSGTENDPYIIENWIIGASTSHGIWIENTMARFVIRNCVVENGDDLYHGICLVNVVNGRIENCTVRNNDNGI